MASTIVLKRRIHSIKKPRQTTKAMQLVAEVAETVAKSYAVAKPKETKE